MTSEKLQAAFSEVERERKEREDQMELAKQLLSDHGFKLTVDGCGCCQSPAVRLTHNDKDVIFKVDSRSGEITELGDCIIKMHDD